jgi:hypothetical protein
MSPLINMTAGSTATTMKIAFPGPSLLAAIWTEYFLQRMQYATCQITGIVQMEHM